MWSALGWRRLWTILRPIRPWRAGAESNGPALALGVRIVIPVCGARGPTPDRTPVWPDKRGISEGFGAASGLTHSPSPPGGGFAP